MTTCLTSMSAFPARSGAATVAALSPALPTLLTTFVLALPYPLPTEGSKHASGQTSDAKLSQTMERMSKPTDRIRASLLPLLGPRLRRLSADFALPTSHFPQSRSRTSSSTRCSTTRARSRRRARRRPSQRPLARARRPTACSASPSPTQQRAAAARRRRRQSASLAARRSTRSSSSSTRARAFSTRRCVASPFPPLLAATSLTRPPCATPPERRLVVRRERNVHLGAHGRLCDALEGGGAPVVQDAAPPAADARHEARIQRRAPDRRAPVDVLQGPSLALDIPCPHGTLTAASSSPILQDQTTMSYSHACLRYLCLLEPSLTVPAILDRTYPSLTGLEEVRLFSRFRPLAPLRRADAPALRFPPARPTGRRRSSPASPRAPGRWSRATSSTRAGATCCRCSSCRCPAST